MYTVLPATAGEACTTSPVANFQASTPLSASIAYTFPSPLPKYTLPCATAGVGNRLFGIRVAMQTLRFEPALVLDRIDPLRLTRRGVDRRERTRRGDEVDRAFIHGGRRGNRPTRL